MRVSFARAWVIAFPLLARAHIMSRRGGSCVLVVREPRRWIRSGCLFFRPHHLIISCGVGGFVLIVPVCRLVLPDVLSSHRERLSAIVLRADGVVSHPLSVSFLYELGKTARNVISCSIALGCPRASRSSSRLARLVGRLVLYRRRGVRSWRVSGLAVLLIGVSSWAGRHSFVLRRSCVLAPNPVLVVSSASRPSSRGASRCLSLMPCGLGWRGVLAVFGVASRLVSSSRGGFGFSFHLGGERMGGGSHPAVPGPVLACLCAVGGGTMPFSPSSFPPALYHPMVAGRKAVRRPPFGSSSPAACSRGCRSCLVSPISIGDGRNGRRRGDCLLGYRHVAHRVSSMGVYNEYDVCDVYKRYKDTMIREYDGYMR